MPLSRLALTAALFAATACGFSQTRHDALVKKLERVYTDAARPTLTPFGSDRELRAMFDDAARLRREIQNEENKRRVRYKSMASASAPAPQSSAPQAESAGATNESITNTQTAGVDEGGIVKVHRDHLVILRRGRLFTVKVGDDSLTPVSHADAFGPGIDPAGAWYDEMLIAGDTAIVIGYSYQRGGTEVGLFDLGKAGTIKHRGTYHLKSNDYYSSRNYASRIVDGKLVFYSPMYLGAWGDPVESFPAVRKWRADAKPEDFKRILQPNRLYRPITGFGAEAIHVVTVCDLATPEMTCDATGVMGPAGRVFYVSEKSVYVWATSWTQPENGQPAQRSMVVRLPLDGSAPTAIRAQGGPVDQFSFLERDQYLNVLVRSETAGDAMWAPEATAGDAAMLRVPVAMFSAQVPEVTAKAYAPLPRPTGHTIQNRFVGDHLLYGSGSSWGYAADQANADKQVFAYRYAGGTAPQTVKLAHPVDRIEALASDAIVIGADGANLNFTSLALDKPDVAVAGNWVRAGAAQGELRSHGFFYKPDPTDPKVGMLGLPVRGADQPGAAHLLDGSASITFVRNRGLQLSPLGELEAKGGSANDGCRASCVDWYGNARPIFMRGRILALMGYELVEGTLAADKLVEKRRVSFAPVVTVQTARPR